MQNSIPHGWRFEIRQGESVGALEQGLAPLEVALARPDGQVLDGSPLDESGSGTVIGVRDLDTAVGNSE